MGKNWSDFLQDMIRFYPVALISIYAIYKSWGEWLKNELDKAKEKSVGEAKMRAIEQDRDEYKKRFHAAEENIRTLERRVGKNEDHIQDITKEIRDNFQQSINILMRGK